jgi:predicted aspartyl protease
MALIVTPLRLRNAVSGGEQIEVDGKVDTGATMLVLPGEVAKRLGLPTIRKQLVKYAD